MRPYLVCDPLPPLLDPLVLTLGNATAPNKGISLTFKGPSYPSSSTLELVPQSFNIRILCATDNVDPTLVSYDGKEAKVEWTSSAGCSFGAPGDSPPTDKPSDDNEKGDEKTPAKVGSGLGYFFLLYVSGLRPLSLFGSNLPHSDCLSRSWGISPWGRITIILPTEHQAQTSYRKCP